MVNDLLSLRKVWLQVRINPLKCPDMVFYQLFLGPCTSLNQHAFAYSHRFLCPLKKHKIQNQLSSNCNCCQALYSQALSLYGHSLLCVRSSKLSAFAWSNVYIAFLKSNPFLQYDHTVHHLQHTLGQYTLHSSMCHLP